MRFISGFLVLISFLTACSKEAVVTQTQNPRSQQKEDREAEVSRHRQLFSEKNDNANYNVLRYELKASFDWTKRLLTGDLKIQIQLSHAQVNAIALDNHTAVTQVTLPADGKIIPFTNEKGALTLDVSGLPAELKKKPIAFAIKYTALAAGRDGRNYALRAVLPRKGDPVSSRVLFTTSEPVSVPEWMPCHNTPVDRAFWHVEFTMPAEETLVSNGTLFRNDVVGVTRTMGFETSYTLPTYLMAIAVGQFETHTEKMGEIPVGVVYRKGLPISATEVTASLIKIIRHYESLLIQYPYEKYYIVVLPEYRGGLEHAGITFQGETSSTLGGTFHDYSLSAHELGHQWFGDYVTVASWNDLWIKEGMATLLAAEAFRSIEDRNQTGRLFGSAFDPVAGDAVIDTSLAPDDKYNSGPYDRSAWVLTQIRSVLGEKAFWGKLKDILKKYAFESITTEEFLGEFSDVLSAAKIAQWKKALVAKALPELQFNFSADHSEAALVLKDPDALLLAPLAIEQFKNGNVKKTVLDQPKAILKFSKNDGFLALDVQDAHPVPILLDKASQEILAKEWISQNDSDWEYLLSLGGHIQDRFFQSSASFTLNTMNFHFGKVASDLAQKSLLISACAMAEKSSAEQKEIWIGQIHNHLLNPPFYAFNDTVLNDPGFSACKGIVTKALVDNLLTWLSGSAVLSSDWPFLQASAFALPPDVSLKAWSAVAEKASSVRRRSLAVKYLARQVQGFAGFGKPSAEQLPQWRTFFQNQLKNETMETLQPALEAIKYLKDESSVPFLVDVVKTKSAPFQENSVCVVFAIAGGTETPLWKQFVSSVAGEPELTLRTQKLLKDPSTCNSKEL